MKFREIFERVSNNAPNIEHDSNHTENIQNDSLMNTEHELINNKTYNNTKFSFLFKLLFK